MWAQLTGQLLLPVASVDISSASLGYMSTPDGALVGQIWVRCLPHPIHNGGKQ